MREQFAEIPINDVIVKDRLRGESEMGDIGDLAESLADLGLMQPILVDQDMNLIAGGRRLAAAKMLGWETITASIRETTSPLRKTVAEMMENIMRKDLTWQEKCLGTERIHEAQAVENPNWTQEKTAKLIGRSVGSVSDQLVLAKAIQAAPDLAKSKTADEANKKIKKITEDAVIKQLRERQKKKTTKKHGTVDALIEEADISYKIGDCIEGLRGLPDQAPDIIFIEADGPYAIDLAKRKRHERWQEEIADYIEIDRKDYVAFLKELCTELFRVSAPNATIVFWFGIEWYNEVLSALEGSGFLVDSIPCMWLKKQGQTNQPEMKLARFYECFIYGRKPDAPFGISQKGRGNVFDFSATYARDKIHPTQKPVDLMLEIIDTFCPMSGSDYTVLVPFFGSGVTFNAARKRGLRCIGWDKNPAYKEEFLVGIKLDYEKGFLVD